VVLHELVVGHPALVHARALGVQLGLGALALGRLLGHPRLLLGALGLPLAGLGLPTVLGGHTLAPLLELAPGGFLARAGAHARKEHGEQDQQQDGNHDDDDRSG
jgi:hypothetical protein